MINKLPGWWVATKIVSEVQSQIEKLSDKEFDEKFDFMLDKKAWCCKFGFQINDKSFEIVYLFQFIKSAIPEFKTDYVKEPAALCGIPYTAMLSIGSNVYSKKIGFLTYFKLIKNILIWQTLVLFGSNEGFYDIKDKKNLDTEIQYNNIWERYVFTHQLLSMLKQHGDSDYLTFIKEASQSREKALAYIEKLFKEDYAYDGLVSFVSRLTEENYYKFIEDCKEQGMVN